MLENSILERDWFMCRVTLIDIKVAHGRHHYVDGLLLLLNMMQILICNKDILIMHFNIFPHHPCLFDLGSRSSQSEAFLMLVRLLLRIRIIQINRFLRGAIQHGWPVLSLSISYWSRGRIYIPKLKSVLLMPRFGKVPRRQMPLAPRSRGAPGMNYFLYCWFFI